MRQKIWIIIDSTQSEVNAFLAQNALKKAANMHNVDVEVAIVKGQSKCDFKSQPLINDAVLLVDTSDAVKKQFVQTSQTHSTISTVLENPKLVLAEALGSDRNNEEKKEINIVAITSCPTGIAHTFMAAEGLQIAAEALGIKIHVETQGSVGAQNALTAEEIANADIVIIAADREVDRSRFNGKRVYSSGTKAAINDGQTYLKTALKDAKLQKGSALEEASGNDEVKKVGPYKHLMTGVSFMLPFVVAGGLLIALAFALGGINAGNAENAGTLAYVLSTIGEWVFH